MKIICILQFKQRFVFRTEVRHERRDQNHHLVQGNSDRQDAVPRNQRIHRIEGPGRDPGAAGGPPRYGGAGPLPRQVVFVHRLAAGRILACHALPILSSRIAAA